MAQYIDKSALVAEIEKRIDRNNERAASYSSNSEHDYLCRVKEKVYKSLLSFVDTLEVKKVDINKEISQFIDTNFEKATIGHKLSLRRVAKHFFELGLSVNNPITAADRGTAEEIILALNTLGEEKMISYDKEIKWLNKIKEL